MGLLEEAQARAFSNYRSMLDPSDGGLPASESNNESEGNVGLTEVNENHNMATFQEAFYHLPRQGNLDNFEDFPAFTVESQRDGINESVSGHPTEDSGLSPSPQSTLPKTLSGTATSTDYQHQKESESGHPITCSVLDALKYKHQETPDDNSGPAIMQLEAHVGETDPPNTHFGDPINLPQNNSTTFEQHTNLLDECWGMNSENAALESLYWDTLWDMPTGTAGVS